MPNNNVPRAVDSRSGLQTIPAPPFIDKRKEWRQSPPKKDKPKARRPKKYTLDEALSEAFTYRDDGGSSTLDLEKSIRCIGYLLEWTSETGNTPPPANFTCSLAKVLSKCADEVRWLITRDEIYNEIRRAQGADSPALEILWAYSLRRGGEKYGEKKGPRG